MMVLITRHTNRNELRAKQPRTETLKENQTQPRSERSARLPLRIFVLSHQTQNRLQQLTLRVALLRTRARGVALPAGYVVFALGHKTDYGPLGGNGTFIARLFTGLTKIIASSAA
jgi:hypothetical protein